MSTSTTAPTGAGLPTARVRAAAAALPAGMALFGLGQVVHGPEVSPTRDLDEFVAAVATPRLAAAHLAIALASFLLLLGTGALYALLASTRAERTALAAFTGSIAGAGLLALGLGAAALAYPDVAAAHEQAPEVLTSVLEGSTRVLAVILAGAGLLTLAGILTAVAVWRSTRLPRGAAIPYAFAVPAVLVTENAPTSLKAVIAVAITAAAWRLAAAMRTSAGGSRHGA